MKKLLLTTILAMMLGLTIGCSNSLDTKAQTKHNHDSGSTHSTESVVDEHAGHDHGTEPVVDAHAGHDHGAEPVVDAHAGHDHGTEPVVDAHAGHGHGTEPVVDKHAEANAVTFLKGQQRMIPFATAQVEKREIRSAVTGMATVNAHPEASWELVAPVSGIVAQTHLFAPGQEVLKGESVLTLLPQLDADGSWADMQSQWDQASLEWERAQRLYDQNAISEREYDQIRLRYYALESGMITTEGNTSSSHFELRAPVAATVVERLVSAGEAVEAGQTLMRLVKRNQYRIMAHVYQLPSGGINSITGLALYPSGMDKNPIVIDEVTPVAAPIKVDVISQAIPLELDVIDVSIPLQLGQRMRVDLFGPVEHNTLAVPESSIFLDEGMKVVFVQVTGESFEKRQVVTGARDGGWIVVDGDIRFGEQVVSTGGYHLKLAGMSAEIGHGHAH